MSDPMKLLIITESIPFPPRNGKELPLANYIHSLSQSFKVDLLVLSNDDNEFTTRLPNVPREINRTFRVRTKSTARPSLLFREVIGQAPAYYVRGFDLEEVHRAFAGVRYDVAWVSPVSCFGFVEFSRRAGLAIASHVALGLNDSMPYAQFGKFRQMLAGTAPPTFGRLLAGLRTPYLRMFERRYVNHSDLVHVQTEQEAQRVRRTAKLTDGGPPIVAVTNGRNEELDKCQYSGVDSRNILFMTPLAGGRHAESWWFLRRIWPKIFKRLPGVRLHIVGVPPAKGHFLYGRDEPGICVLGCVPNLMDVYENVALSVLPIFHGSGIVNRVLDSLSAGVPIVTTPAPLATVKGAKPGVHAVTTSRADNFADLVVRTLIDREERLRLSDRGRVLAAKQPTWAISGDKIARSLRDLASNARRQQ